LIIYLHRCIIRNIAPVIDGCAFQQLLEMAMKNTILISAFLLTAININPAAAAPAFDLKAYIKNTFENARAGGGRAFSGRVPVHPPSYRPMPLFLPLPIIIHRDRRAEPTPESSPDRDRKTSPESSGGGTYIREKNGKDWYIGPNGNHYSIHKPQMD
jgi:hypothetical protein